VTHLPATIEIAASNSKCTICPELGGALLAWSVDDQNMLRRASAADVAARDPLRLSSFPLVPYSNRIDHGRFDWNGQQIEITPNFAPEPHAIHGIGWKESWTVANQADDQVTLRLAHTPDARWPWAFEAEQKITVTADALTLSFFARNLSGAAAPLAFGQHPYFDQAGAHLHFLAEQVWMSGADCLPTQAVKPAGNFDFSGSPAVTNHDVDHCYVGWTSPAHIMWHGRPLRLEISASPHLKAAVVYVPKGGDAFCFEPVPHINNALNLAGHAPAMPIVQPGDSFAAEIKLQAFAA
jgi:aldose 1-epimerase